MSKWIDFKTLREKLSFPAVLELYDVDVKAKADGQAHGFCPLPTHDGEQKSPSFSAHLQRGVWQCFGCGAKGNVLDFAIRMEGLSPDKSADVRTVAAKLKDQFHIDCEVERPPRSGTSKPNGASAPKPRPKRTMSAGQAEQGDQPLLGSIAPPNGDASPEVKVNAPLDFELKGLQADHPYLLGRGFTTETLWRFGVGYCARGSLAGRIAIPLQDAAGLLVGYAGRVVDDATINEECPKYKFPSRRERNGSVLEFRKSHLLYNANRITDPVDTLVVVEGFPSVWWLTQAGITNVVALMGASCSAEQAAIIKVRTTPDARVWIMPDGDDAGNRCAASATLAIGQERWTRWVGLPPGTQPTAHSASDLHRFLNMSE